jgi:hypothetical protein
MRVTQQMGVYAAVTRDEGNAADGRLPTASIAVSDLQYPEERRRKWINRSKKFYRA